MNPTLYPCPVAALAGQPLWLLGLLRAKEERKGSAFSGERSRRKRFNILGKYIRKMTLKIAQNLPNAWQLLFARQRGGGGGPQKEESNQEMLQAAAQVSPTLEVIMEMAREQGSVGRVGWEGTLMVPPAVPGCSLVAGSQVPVGVSTGWAQSSSEGAHIAM